MIGHCLSGHGVGIRMILDLHQQRLSVVRRAATRRLQALNHRHDALQSPEILFRDQCFRRLYMESVGIEIADQGLEPPRIDTWLALVLLQRVDVMVQLLVDLATDVSAQQDREYLQQGADRGARAPAGVCLGVVQHLPVQEFDAQEGAHAFAQR